MAQEGSTPRTMKALVAYSKDKYVFEPTYPAPECGPDDIIVKTEACGICAGDLKCRTGAAMFWGDDIQPAWVKPPFIPGHEFFGRIVEIGEDVEGYYLGERITADQIVPCGKCRFCKDGHYWMCQPHDMYGYQSCNDGGMAEYVRYKKNSVISRVPENMSLEQAVLIEPYGCSKHAVDRAEITNEDVVVIAGAGTLGLGMVTYARMKNPKKLIVLDIADLLMPRTTALGGRFSFPFKVVFQTADPVFMLLRQSAEFFRPEDWPLPIRREVPPMVLFSRALRRRLSRRRTAGAGVRTNLQEE